jgi:hypothetical protein
MRTINSPSSEKNCRVLKNYLYWIGLKEKANCIKQLAFYISILTIINESVNSNFYLFSMIFSNLNVLAIL